MNTVAVTAANRPRRKITLTRIFRYPFPDWFLVIETSVRMRPNACQVCKLPHRRDRGGAWDGAWDGPPRSEEHTSELQSLMRISYAVFCLKKKKKKERQHTTTTKHDQLGER